MPKTYYIFRHGETYFSKHDINYDPESRVNTPLLPESFPAINRLANFLKDKLETANFTSSYPRCVETSRIVGAKAGKNFFQDDRLIDEWITEGRETFEGFVERFRNFLNEISQLESDIISICTHGWPITVLVNLLTKGEMKKDWLDNIIKPGELIIIKDGKVETKSFRKN